MSTTKKTKTVESENQNSTSTDRTGSGRSFGTSNDTASTSYSSNSNTAHTGSGSSFKTTKTVDNSAATSGNTLTAQLSKELTAEGDVTDYGTSPKASTVAATQAASGSGSSSSSSSSGSSGSSSSSSSSSSGTSSDTAATDYTAYEAQTFDPESYEEYVKAKAALESVNANKPADYVYADQAKLDELYEQIMNPTAYSYDASSDAAYQNYVDQYSRLGQQAMEDTVGQASALTGGYSNTYAQNAGQQAYNDYMAGLADKSAELESQAYSRYQDELDRNQNLYSLQKSDEEEAYSRYNDEYNKWLTERDTAKADLEDAYNTAYNQWSDEQDSRDDWYTRMMTVWQSTGQAPTEADMDAAGLSDYEKAAWQQYYASQTSGSSSGSGSTAAASTDDTDEEDSSGVSTDSYYMQLLGAVATAKDSGNSGAYLESVNAINDAYSQGLITSDQATKLKSIARPSGR